MQQSTFLTNREMALAVSLKEDQENKNTKDIYHSFEDSLANLFYHL
jgi:hypothetical protein